MARNEKREEVYEIIDEERDYQHSLGSNRTDHSEKSVGDYLTMMSSYFRAAQDGWTNNAGTVFALHEIRKIAAIAVRCMEEHGAYPRGAYPREVK
jgi:hypothetical protein